jgi:hypothetical protein
MDEGRHDVPQVYSDLRSQVLQLRAAPGADAETAVIAVLMETGFARAVATLVAVSDGTVSLYFSTGGGIIGAGEHNAVRRIGRELLASAKQYVPDATATESCPLTEVARVRFYFVTPVGTYTLDAPEKDLRNRRHRFSPLYRQGHRLIAAMRKHTSQ